MTLTWQDGLFLLALVCFVAAAFNVTAGRLNLVAAGLALWVLVPTIHTLAA